MDFKKLSDEYNFSIVVLYFPYAYDAYNNNNEVYEKLCDILRPMDIDVINLIPRLYSNKDKRLYYPLDGHPTRVGQRLAAEEIFEFLKKNNYLSNF